MPGMSSPSGLGTVAQRDRACGGVHLHAAELQRACVRVGAAVIEHQRDACRAFLVLRELAIGELLFQAQYLGARLRDVHVQRVKLRDGGQRLRLAGREQGAGRDAGGAAAPADRRLDAAVAQGQLGRAHGGLGRGDVRFALRKLRLAVIVLLLADGPGLDQLGIARGVHLRGALVRPGLGQLRLRRGQLHLQARRVDLVEHLPGLDLGALGEQALLQDAGCRPPAAAPRPRGRRWCVPAARW